METAWRAVQSEWVMKPGAGKPAPFSMTSGSWRAGLYFSYVNYG